MKWEKLGQIFDPQKINGTGGYASNPFALQVTQSTYKVFFNCRDQQNRSLINCFDLDLEDPTATKTPAAEPLLGPGNDGLFDDSGVSLGCLVENNDKIFLYYVGWNLTQRVPWRNSIGLAVSEDGGRSFKKHSQAPIVDRSEVDPYSLSYPFVLKEGGKWRMWYGTNRSWGNKQNEMDHIIRYAESVDGVHFTREGHIALDHEKPDQYALARPSVLKAEGQYFMWYSYRGQNYRIGFAESSDGIDWKRRDSEVGLEPAQGGEAWDSQAICYPHVFQQGENIYMLYVGNDYGKGGIGLAKTELSQLS